VDGDLVSKEAVVEAFEELRPHFTAEPQFTPFEKLTAMAFWIFRKAGVDYGVIETGLGGRFDATNHIEAPVVIGLARVGFDHIHVLGRTLAEIGSHKAGIIKAGVPAFAVPQDEEVRPIFDEEARKAGVDLSYVAATDAAVTRAGELAHETAKEAGNAGMPSWLQRSVGHMPAWLTPAHQQENFALAARMVLSLVESGVLNVTPATGEDNGAQDLLLRSALRTKWPGRGELIFIPPTEADQAKGAKPSRIIFDVAHNEDAARALLANLHKAVPPGKDGGQAKVEVVFGANKDKDAHTMLNLLAETVARGAEGEGANITTVHLIHAMHPKATPTAELHALAKEVAADVPWRAEYGSVEEAISVAAAGGAFYCDCTVVFGSVFVVADARTALYDERPDVFGPADWAQFNNTEPLLMPATAR